jgi:hypothetical protein
MGASTDAAIAAWQKQAGIEPARGQKAEALRDLSQAAFEMIKVVELESSGIRDGDGYWHGADVMGGVVGDVVAAFHRWRDAKANGRETPDVNLTQGAGADDIWGGGFERVT